MNLVFVYGTLKSGHQLNRVLADSIFVGEGVLDSTDYGLFHLGAFPAVMAVGYPRSYTIRGEVYQVDNITLMRLDQIEGVPILYERLVETIKLNSGENVQANVYVMRGGSEPHSPEITTGEW